jgi:hypothetical protein
MRAISFYAGQISLYAGQISFNAGTHNYNNNNWYVLINPCLLAE